jgi:Integrase core domain
MTTPASIAFGCETTAMRSITRGRRGYTTASRMAPMVTGGYLHRARSSTNKLFRSACSIRVSTGPFVRIWRVVRKAKSVKFFAFNDRQWSECLDRLLIVNQRHLERSLDVFVTHYNSHRPHRALSLTPPEPKRAPGTPARTATRVECRDRLGGVIHEYVLAA